MKRYAPPLLMLVAVLGGASTVAQPDPEPPMARPSPPAPSDAPQTMPMTPEEMRNMPSEGARGAPMHEAHAPEPALERPAASQSISPLMMPGMDMNDEGIQHRLWIENLEGVAGTPSGGAWDAQAWMGGDFDKLWVKSEGAIRAGKTQDSKVEALWAHALLPFWDTQLGVRHDFSAGPTREWAAFGVQGIAPYWFDVELTGYLGEAGRTAVRLKVEYNLYFTQRLILKPEIELNAYGKSDPAREIGAGLSDGQFALRLRYEFTRRFAPYVGYLYDHKFSGSATLAREAGNAAVDHRVVAGVAFFF